MPAFDVEALRRRFSSLGQGFAFFDAPGGSQVPDEVGEAMARALREASANLGAPYATGHRVEQIVDEAKAGGAGFLGCEPAEVVFGTNMTTLNFALSRTAARDFAEGDEILVTRLDHDGNVAPWLEAAEDHGLVVKVVDVHADTTLDLDDLESKLSERTRVVAFPWASNAVGTITDARRIGELAHRAGALSWIDAVHYAAHEPIDVRAVDADVLLCSPYKFCGPHLGMAYVRESLAATWRPYKARPSATTPTARRFETGTLPYELLAGFIATLDYLESIGGWPRRGRTSARSASSSSRTCPRARRSTACRRWRGASRRSSSTSTACPPATSRSASPSAASASGATTTTTRWASIPSSATTRPCGSACCTTTPPRRSSA